MTIVAKLSILDVCGGSGYVFVMGYCMQVLYIGDFIRRITTNLLNVVEITQIRLQKMKKNVAMTSFYCLGSKI